MGQIDICFQIYRYQKFYIKMAAWWGGGLYNHTEIRFSDGLCFAAHPADGGVRFKEKVIDDKNWDIISIILTDEEEQKMRAWCEKQVGKPFDWLAFLGFQLPAGFGIQDPRRWYCSEVDARALTVIGIIGYYRRIDPNKLYNLLILLCDGKRIINRSKNRYEKMEDDNTYHYTAAFVFSGFLSVILLILKLCGIKISWWWVLAPLGFSWGLFALSVCIFAIAILLLALLQPPIWKLLQKFKK
jgi:hypothetical protein